MTRGGFLERLAGVVFVGVFGFAAKRKPVAASCYGTSVYGVAVYGGAKRHGLGAA